MNSKWFASFGTVSVTAIIAVVACSHASGGSVESDETADWNRVDVIPIQAPEMVRCWLAPAPPTTPASYVQQDALWCADVFPNSFPVNLNVVGVTINVTTSNPVNSKNIAAHPTYLEQSAGTPVSVTPLDKSDYPIHVRVDIQLVNPPIPGLGRDGQNGANQLSTAFDVAGANELVLARPKIIKLPFDLWPVQIFFKNAAPVGSLQYTLKLDPFTDLGATSLGMTAQLPSVVPGADDQFYLAVNAGSSALSGSALFENGTNAIPFSLDKPGFYVAEPQGLRHARADEIRNLSDGGFGNPFDAGATNFGPSTSPNSPVPPPVIMGDCGTAEKACCGGTRGTCDTASYCHFGKCEACGTAGASCCGGSGGTCDSVSRCHFGKCEACGTVGAACCGGSLGTCDTSSHCKVGMCVAL